MGYVIAALIVILIIAGFVLLLTRNAMDKSNVADAHDPGDDQNALGILGSDGETPAGDTNQHSEAETGTSPRGEVAAKDSPAVGRPVVGGEAEGERSL